MKKTLPFIFFLFLGIPSNGQGKNQLNLNAYFGNAWYTFDPDKIKGIFIEPHKTGLHGNNLAQCGVELEYGRRIVNRLWFMQSSGLQYSKLNYTDRADTDPDTYFHSSEIFVSTRAGLRFYASEYRSPMLFLELQPGLAYSLWGASGKTDYMENDFYKPGDLLYYFQAGLGYKRIIMFYRQYAPRDMAADNIKVVGLMANLLLK